jgi:hypothetical protein
MNMHMMTSVKALTDADLLSRLADLARRERGAAGELIAHLAELDARGLYRGEGHGSLFRYCTDALMLSEHAAYARIEAARIARTFPVVLDRLADGSLNVTTLGLLGPHLRPENYVELLAAAAGRSKRDVAALVARLAPQPDVPASVRKLPTPVGRLPTLVGELPTPPPADALQEASASLSAVPKRPTSSFPLVPANATVDASDRQNPAGLAHSFASASHRPAIIPLAPERYRIQFTMGAETHEKLRLVQDLLRREIPDGDPALIFDRALTLLLEDTARKKLGAASRPRPGRSSPGSRHIPAAVKRTVWAREGGRCGFVAKTGRRCAERAYLEFHHIEPYAVGGETNARNISLRCRSHNVYEAELTFGSDVIAARQSEARARTRSGTSTANDPRPTAPMAEVRAEPSNGA